MKLHFYTDEFDNLIQNYTITEEQLRFTGTPRDAINLSKADKNLFSVLAMKNKQLVTFFALHRCEGVEPYSTNENAILIRTFSTDFHHQGKGYAKNALMLVPELVNSHFVNINEIVLAVNVKNEIAQAVYKKCGYIDEGHRVMGTRGELIIMCYRL
ncbi:GNAT family N-acetyltransferase [Sporosarcina sp. JAI121]|uniref:GNAT family N-acetyltransferase n=1 Tax=Sporosarcina sp. JAI121 TaxID=2723064 RepID=UPI0015CDA60C|nr:GNAT family protein [Sporosarcina sp. JAI121]NYF24809.1 RimJ/RimL family protein N-acetyltransferase [Sporosarcina sp. JAI121]